MINILQVIAPIGMGGAENVLLNINNLIDKSRYRLSFCLFINPKRGRNELYERLKEFGCDVSVISMLIRKFPRGDISGLVRVINSNRIDIVHTHGYRSDILGLIASKITKRPLVSTVHGWTSESSKVILYEYIQKKIMRYLDMIMPVSQQIYDELLEKGMNRQRMRKVSNIIDYRSFETIKNHHNLRSQYNIHKDSPVIGTVGRLGKEKGHIVFLQAIGIVKQHYPNIKALIIGEGDQKEELSKFVTKERMDETVCFCGFQKNVAEFYSLFDIFVLPSVTEGLPLVLLEAMYFKKPIVASKVGGIPEVIVHGLTGELVPPGEPIPFAESILRFLDDKSYAKKVGTAGHKYLLKNFNPEGWIQAIENVYQSAYGSYAQTLP